MAKAPGHELALKWNSTQGGNYTAIAMIESVDVAYESGTVEATTHGDTDANGYLHKVFIPTVNDNPITVTAVLDTINFPQKFLRAFRNRSTLFLEVDTPNLGTLRGEFYAQSLAVTGQMGNLVRATITLVSAAAPTHTDATSSWTP